MTNHYAIIPTGQGLGALKGLSLTAQWVYETIVRRFLSIFYPPAVYQKVSLVTKMENESFFSSFKVLLSEGYLKIAANSFAKKSMAEASGKTPESEGEGEVSCDEALLAALQKLKKGDILNINGLGIKEGETSPPKRYSSGTLILAMENAGQLIEDEELRSQIKGSGIGTSATRDSIITKLVTNKYIALNKKTQIVTPTFLGEIIYDVCLNSIQSLLWAEMTASWEKGLSGVAEGTISKDEYTAKMNKFVCDNTNAVKQIRNQNQITRLFDRTKPFYEKAGAKKAAKKS